MRSEDLNRLYGQTHSYEGCVCRTFSMFTQRSQLVSGCQEALLIRKQLEWVQLIQNFTMTTSRSFRLLKQWTAIAVDKFGPWSSKLHSSHVNYCWNLPPKAISKRILILYDQSIEFKPKVSGRLLLNVTYCHVANPFAFLITVAREDMDVLLMQVDGWSIPRTWNVV